MDELPEVYRSLAAGFDTEIVAQKAPTLDDVHAFVRRHVARLLDENPGMLMSILYRIDVAESSVQEVLRKEPHEAIPDRLSELIVERQLQKVRTRRMYRDKP